MNRNIYNFIEGKQAIGVKHWSELTEMEIMRIAGYLMLDAEDPLYFLEEPLLYLAESDNRTITLAHHLIQYCVCTGVNSMNFWKSQAVQEIAFMDIYPGASAEEVFEKLHQATLKYFTPKVEELFDKVKGSTGFHPKRDPNYNVGLHEYGVTRSD